jgi:hypothetical protein
MSGEEDLRSMLAKRAKVPPRDNSLKLGNPKRTSHGSGEAPDPVSSLRQANWTEEETSGTFLSTKAEDIKISSSSVKVDSVVSSASLSTTDLNHIEAELEKLPKTGKRLAIHLEEKVRNELIAFCDRQELTPEVFLEAIFVNFQQQNQKADSKKLAKVINDAKQRLATRKKVGLLKRTLSMINKIKY